MADRAHRADKVTPAQHLISRFIVGRDRDQIMHDPLLRFQQFKAFADTGQHTQGQHIDLQNAQPDQPK